MRYTLPLCVALFTSIPTIAAAQDGYLWREQLIPTPPGRFAHAMCFDTVRGVTVMFGGEVEPGQEFGDTWTYDGSSWQSHEVSGPSPRSTASLAFDEARGEAVLFGGSAQTDSGRVHNSDTWLWDGTTWTLASEEGPDARNLHAMVYDPDRGRVVLIGGVRYDPGCGCWVHLQDTWEWDGSSWSQSVAPPTPWGNQAAFFDHQLGETIVFGGASSQGGGTLGDTYSFDGSAWTLVAQDGPPARINAGSAATSAGGFGILIGGRGCSSCGPLNDMWVWRDAGWVEWSNQGIPPGREGPMAYDSKRDAFVVFGGLVNDGGVLDDHWEFMRCHVDLTEDGEVDTRDFLLYLGAWSQSDPLADWDDNGTINTLDFLAYLNDWVAGC